MNGNFKQILQETEKRFLEINRLLFLVHKLEKRKNQKIQKHPSATYIWEDQLDTLKGMIFVQLYGCIEYVTSSSIRMCDTIITTQGLKLSAYKYSLFSRFLNGHFDKLHNAGREKKWLKRFEFMHEILQDIDIKENCCKDLEMPTDGKNIRFAQLKSIWETFGIKSDILPDLTLGNRLSDVANNRNLIAHGNISPSEQGKRQSYKEMKERVNEIQLVCMHIIESFSRYIQNKDYLK